MKHRPLVALLACSLAGAAAGGTALLASPAHADPTRSEAPAPAPATSADPLEGTFVFAGGAAGRQAVARAIDRSVRPFFFLVRVIARGKLEDRTRIAPEVMFHFEGDRIRSRIPGAPDAVSPASGAPVDYTVLGETVKLSHRREPGRLVETFAGAEGTRTNVVVPSPDGARFTMHVTISSPKLSVPVRFALDYARAATASPAPERGASR